MILRLYSFRYSPDGEHWVKARYRAQAPEIRTRWLDYEIGNCELRDVPDNPYTLGAGAVASAATGPHVLTCRLCCIYLRSLRA